LWGWSPSPGGPDVSLYLAGAARPHAIIECKWSLDGDNLYEFLNDALKLTAAYKWPGFAAGYLLAGAPAALWATPTVCADWFPEAPGAIMCVPLAALLEQHAALWQTIRDRSAGTPPPACAEVELRAVARTQFSIRNGQGSTEAWETRCTRLVPV
jgi:hypothetical protein